MVRELALLVALLVSPAAAPAGTSELPVRVVVNAANPITSIRRADLSAIFMKRVQRWPDGTEIAAVEPPLTSPAREHFSRTIHGKSVAYVTRYWHRLIFSGRGVPPREARSDQAVMEIVRSRPGAIGYIDLTTPTVDGVRVIAVLP
jgi:ABC-type phosphate transport system substrate-binding protein